MKYQFFCYVYIYIYIYIDYIDYMLNKWRFVAFIPYV